MIGYAMVLRKELKYDYKTDSIFGLDLVLFWLWSLVCQTEYIQRTVSKENKGLIMSFGKPKKVAPPGISEIPEPVPTITKITQEGRKAGETERRRLKGRRGKAATRLTTPGFLVPAQVERRWLKTKFG